MTKATRSAGWYWALLLLGAAAAQAHPHLFVEPSVAVVAKADSLELQVRWDWDEFWSSEILLDCDRNQDGVLDSVDTGLVYRHYFSATEAYGFFMQVSLYDEPAPVAVHGFQATVIEGPAVRFQFHVPLCPPPSGAAGSIPVSVVFNDASVYTAFGGRVSIHDPRRQQYSDVSTGESGYYGAEISFLYLPPH